MKKLLFSFFLALSAFLITGNSQLHAHEYNDTINEFAVKSAGVSVHSEIANLILNQEWQVEPSTVVVKSKSHTLDNEVEEDSLNGGKKYSLDKYFSSFYFTQLPGYFSQHYKNGLHSGIQFLHFTSTRLYIVFRVIRI